jgi:hypothetical protein
MNGSPYLQQALQAMAQAPQAQGMPLSPEQMQAMVQKRQAFEAQNPDKSYVQHNIAEALAGLRRAPQSVAAVPGNLSALFNFMRPGG